MRIDPAVLAAERAEDGRPDRGQVRDPNQYPQFTRPNCGGDFIPLVSIAEKLIIGGIDASGRDWRQDFHTHPDEYAAYREAKRREKRGGLSLSVSVRNSR